MKTTYQSAILILATVNFFAFAAQAADYNYTTKNGTITITRYTGSGGAVTMPDQIDGLPVTSIGQEAFYACTTLTTLTMGNSLTNIGTGAFQNCSNVTRIMIPDSVSVIGNSAFYSCTSLTNVTIPKNLTGVGQYTFAFCSSLKNVTIPNGVTSIGRYAFGNCTSLSSVTIPNSVTFIDSSAFYFCTSLTSVTIPNSVPNLGRYAFAYCSSLSSVYFMGNAAGVDSTVFVGDNNSTVYYLPGTTGWGLTYGDRPTAPWALSYPVILTAAPGFGIQSNRFGFNISWATNTTVVVEASTSLVLPTWSAVSTNTLTLGSSYFSDASWKNYPTRFYRIRAL